MIVTFVVVVSLLAIVNLTLMGIVIWSKTKEHPSNFWFGWMFFATVLAILDNLLIYTNHGTVFLYLIGIISNLVYGAYLISYYQSYKNPEIKKIRFNWKLFIPGFLYLPFIIYSIFQPNLVKEAIQLAREGQMSVSALIVNFIICGYTIASNITLLIKELTIRRKQKSKSLSSSFFLEFLFVILVLQLAAFLPLMLNLDILWVIIYMPVFGQLFFIYVFIRFMIFTKKIEKAFANQDVPLNSRSNIIALSNEKVKEIQCRIVEYMAAEKPYLKIDYTLTDMSKDLNIIPRYLSMVINNELNCSFPDYINSFRVKAAISLLENIDKNNMKIEVIAFDCGFNNRTSFYNAFKKFTGKLPSEFIVKTNNNKFQTDLNL